MTQAAFDLDPSVAARPTLGLIVLAVDETIESDFRRLMPGTDHALHVSRIPSGADLTPDTIATMKDTLPAAAGLLPQTPEYDVVGYACTSGTTLIGAGHVAALVRQGCSAKAVCDPLSAAIAACRHLDITRLGIVSPYIDTVAQPVCAAFEASGIAVPHAINFGERVEANVARIAPASTARAARDLAGRGGIDAVFLSCTNLVTLDIIAALEEESGLPVLSSNLVLAWAMARLAGLTLTGPGRLVTKTGR